jgi:hydroxymethylpyrimidine/phosphomethylpyrimidine kinase
MTTVLSVGTTHPWNIAGLGLDLLIGSELGARVLSVRTAVSAQDANGVSAIETLSPEIVRAQFESIAFDQVDAVRVGALPTATIVHEVAGALRRLYDVPVVVDPVMHATRGGTLADRDAVQALRAEIASLPNVILTPNLSEGSVLLGRPAIDRDGLADAARELLRLGARAVLLKGGHLEENPVDALATIDHVELLSGSRIDGELRGTGCILAMALACALAQGNSLRDAVQIARTFVRGKIATAREFGGLPVAY